MVEGQQDAGAVNFKTNRHFEEIRQRLPDGGLFFGLYKEKQKSPIAGAANLSTLCARRHSALVISVNLGRRNGAGKLAF